MQLSRKCILQFNIIKEIKENFQLFFEFTEKSTCYIRNREALNSFHILRQVVNLYQPGTEAKIQKKYLSVALGFGACGVNFTIALTWTKKHHNIFTPAPALALKIAVDKKIIKLLPHNAHGGCRRLEEK